jgi:prophage tail gpP-like protein
MPNPVEVCTVTVGGTKYDIWETVEVTRSIDDRTIDHCMLTVAENSQLATSLSNIKLAPGDQVSVALAGQTVINGTVYLRQAAYDGQRHAVQIGITSRAQDLIATTVDANPGQHVNKTAKQIGSEIAGKVGVSFSIVGNPSGADKIFKRFSEHMGETKFACIDRMCRMRNLHLMDNGGNLVAFRGPSQSSGLTLEEGHNILRARVLLANDYHADVVTTYGNDYNNESADANRNPQATITVRPAPGGKSFTPYSGTVNRKVSIAAEEPADQEACQLRAQHEGDFIKFRNVDGDITVQGWLTPGGDLWFNHLRETLIVKSPMLVPSGVFGFMIKGIVHRQDSLQGTTTDVLVCRIDGKGTNADIVNPPSN